MRWKRLNRWVAGGVAGCPGTVDVSTAEDPPVSMPAPRVGAMNPAVGSRTAQPARRSGWVTAAAAILVVQGVIGFAYLPLLAGGSLEQIQPFLILLVTVSVLHLAAAIGLFRLRDWARFLAGLLAAVVLVFMYAPALVVAVSHGVWLGFAWLGTVGNIVVLFAVARRWPAEQKR